MSPTSMRSIIEQVSELSEAYYSIEEINFDAEVEKTLMGLGFVRCDFTRPTSEFSRWLAYADRAGQDTASEAGPGSSG